MKQQPPLKGCRLYNEYGHGGFLLVAAGGKIFIDGRMPAWRIGDREILKDYLALSEPEPPDLSVLARYRVNWALVRRDSPLRQALDGEPEWGRLYEDTKVPIFAKSGMKGSQVSAGEALPR